MGRQEIDDLINESVGSLLLERKVLVDNFTEIAKRIDAKSQGDTDKFYYIEIKQRYKDNKGIQKTGNFDAFGIYLGSYRVKTGAELLALKPKIVSICDSKNARAYITQNPRSESAIKAYAQNPRFQRNMKHRNPLANAEDILSGQAKIPYDENGKLIMNQAQMLQNFGSDRSGFMFDIDEKDKRVWELTKIVLDHFNIHVETEKETPSGGLHIICDNAFDANLPHVMELLRVFDHKIEFEKDQSGRVSFDRHGNPKFKVGDFFFNRGINQTVHANFDAKLLLYSNVDTPGY